MVTLETLHALFKEKFEQNEKEHNDIKALIKKTNGGMKLNTQFRYMAYGGFTILSFLGITLLVKLYI